MPATTQTLVIPNAGPNTIRITGGTAGTPIDVSPSTSATVTLSDASPLQIELLDGSGLAGGHGEE